MKYLLSLLLALAVFAIPALASAYNNVQLVAQLPGIYPEGHHYQIGAMSQFGAVAASDSLSVVQSAFSGYFAQNGSDDQMGTGIIQYNSGPLLYFWIRGQHANFAAGPGCVVEWGGDGCTLAIANLTAPGAQPVRIQLDWYPSPYNYWIAWAWDVIGNQYEIGTYYSSSDWLTNISMRTIETYYSTSNPYYLIDAEWKQWFGWTNGAWASYGYATTYPSYTNPADANYCPAQYAFLDIPLPQDFIAGSTLNWSSNAFCIGTVY